MPGNTNTSSIVDLRTAVDDFLPLCMERLGYRQSFALIDLKIALGYLTVAIAGFLFYLDKKMSFADTYYIIAGAVATYFVVSSVLYFFTSGPKYKNNKYIGHKGLQKVAVFTWTKGYEPVYHVKVVTDDKFDGAVEKEVSFTEMFDAFGFLNEEAALAQLSKIVEKKSE